MKKPRHSLLLIALALMVNSLGSSCSKEETAGSKVNVSAMITALKGQNKEAQVNACAELAKAGPEAAPAVSALLPLLKDQDPLVRRLAAYALGQVGPKASQAIPALKELLKDSDRDVLTATVNALRSIDPKSAGDGKLLNVQSPP